MSLYNMINKVSPVVFLILPMLGKHPDRYPRFRDAFTHDSDHPDYDNHIHVYTRTGGGNREHYQKENQAMRDMEGFVTDFDDSADSTYASWVFKVPDKWQADFDNLMHQKAQAVSKEYIEHIKTVFPKLASQIDNSFKENK